MTVRYDIQQVTRYILTRTMNTDKGATVADLAEFKRRDDAERVMGTMRAAIHPVETAANSECIRINNEIAISLMGIDELDTTSALELLEARAANAQRLWQSKLRSEAGKA
jgi:hypothetical protein